MELKPPTMARYVISGCTVEDAEGVGRVNVEGCWTQWHWRLLWKGKTQEYIVQQCIKRAAYNVLKESDYKRHEKVINTNTGEMVGYCRWRLPKQGLRSPESHWIAAKTPRVSREREL